MKPTKYILLLTGFLGLGACSADEQAGGQEAVGDAIAFTVSTGRGATRAFTYDNKWTMNDNMAVCEGTSICRYKAAEGSAESGDRVSLTANPDVQQKQFYWSHLVISRTFCAWYPYSTAKPSSVTVPTDQSTTENYDNLDILYAPDVTVTYQAGKANKEPVDLTFYHQMCRIVVTVNSTATKGAKPVTSIMMGKGNIATAGTLTPGYTGTDDATASWSLGSQTGSVQMRRTNVIAVDNPTTIRQYTYECIVPPQSLAGTAVLFQITTTDKNNETKTTEYIPSNLYQDAPDFQAGYQYNFMLTLSRQGTVNISTCQVIDWTTSNVSDLTATVPDAGY